MSQTTSYSGEQDAGTASHRRQATDLLQAWRHGDDGAFAQLLHHVYTELRRLARHYLNGERRGHTLQPTALVHEAYLRLLEQRSINWQSRAHFIALAATMMRRVLLNHARARQAEKRGGPLDPSPLTELVGFPQQRAADLIALDDALRDLARLEPRLERILELRMFGGFSVDETARFMSCSPSTVKRDLRLGLAWLQNHLGAKGGVVT